MSLIPYVFANHWPLNSNDFGLALNPDDHIASLVPQEFWTPWRQMANMAHQELGTIKEDKDKFQVNLDVHHFSPEELTVKTADGYLVVEGKHEEKRDLHGYVSRQFTRRYALPQGCQEDAVVSKLSSDGVLSITAPRQPPAVKSEKTIPIQHTGPIRKEIKDATSTN